MIAAGDNILVGQPFVKNATVTAEVVEHLRGPPDFQVQAPERFKRRGHRDEHSNWVTGIET
jgi:ribosomal protein L21